jgi:uncharacterized membrane protein YheB (UPF0754 family)
MSGETISLLTIPLFSAAIGYVTNWTGVWMLFNPVRFRGFKLPGLRVVAQVMPRRVQQIPGLMVGGVGWQGIIPSRAAKMGSIAVDKGIAKLGKPGEFWDQIDPERVADYIVESSRDDTRELVERAVRTEHPRLWRELTPEMRDAIHSRVMRQYPQIVHEIFDSIGRNIDTLIDIKLMVIRRIEEEPALGNKIFKSVGDKELKLIINMGFWLGLALGIPVAVLTGILGSPLVLLVLGPVVGWTTNWVAIMMIFEPVEPRRIGPWTWQGLFLKRQKEAADVYADVIAEDIVTIRNIGQELLHGPRSDRTREMIAAALRPAVDRATGPARAAVRVAVGTREYDNIREQVALEGVEYTMNPLKDEEFNRRQSARVRELISTRMREMEPTDFSEMLRSAMREDEWLLIAHGAVLGFGAGLVHFALFGV